MTVYDAAQIAINHSFWDGQDPHTCIEESMQTLNCTLVIRARHRGSVLVVEFIVEPITTDEETYVLKPVKWCYLFARSARIEQPQDVETVLDDLRRAGLEFTLL